MRFFVILICLLLIPATCFSLTDVGQAFVTVRVNPKFSLILNPNQVTIFQVDRAGIKVFDQDIRDRFDVDLYKKFLIDKQGNVTTKTRILKLTVTEK
ncbi:MAG: hypothetical protein V1843_01895 [bacterium]